MRGEGVPGDALLAVMLYVGGALLWALGPPQFWPESWPLSLAWWAVGVLPLALRRSSPWWAVAILTVHTPLSLVLMSELPNTTAGVIVMTYTVAAYLTLRQAVSATALMWLPGVAIALLHGNFQQGPLRIPTAYIVLINVMTATVCFFIGRTVCNRRAYMAALEDRTRTYQATQHALTAQAVAAERRRIARELHDVVAHHVSVMGVLATGSRRTLRRDPAAADEALATIEETGRSALREMRRLLDVLRTDDSEPADELAPQPGLAGVGVLVEQIREAGLPATLHVDGDPPALDPGVALTVYRIVQEALTNALKHAGAATVEVRLSFGTYWLIVEVCDNGRGPRSGVPPIGHGLLGMRERVSLYGGTLRTGPRSGGGYRVYAKIPLEGTGSPLDTPPVRQRAGAPEPAAAAAGDGWADRARERAAAVVQDGTVTADARPGGAKDAAA